MGNRTVKEMLRDVQNKTEATSKAANDAKDLISPALKPALEKPPTLGEIQAMDRAMQHAQACYLESISVYSEFREAVELLGKNKAFMGKLENKAAYQKFEQFRNTNRKFLDQVGTSLDQLELWLIALKKQAGIDMPELSNSSREGDMQEVEVNTKIKKKCAPGCTIL